uniref:Putative secreted protein n=1 Tax=Ixodes ricinus TaxID=34613 RepID=A0A6B0UKR8_IXORI
MKFLAVGTCCFGAPPSTFGYPRGRCFGEKTKLFLLLSRRLNNVCARRLLQILWERAAQLSTNCRMYDLGLLFNLSIPRSFEILTFDAGSLFVSTAISWHNQTFFFFPLWYGF